LFREDLITLPPGEIGFTDWLGWDREGSLVHLDPLELLSSEVRDRMFVTGNAAKSPTSILVGTGPNMEDRLRLHRVLARSFPGGRTASKITGPDAAEAMDSRGLLVRAIHDNWTFEPGKELSIASCTRITGTGYDKLVDAIRYLEIANG
jgi:hypothetical protein